jgi:hypothetical protein
LLISISQDLIYQNLAISMFEKEQLAAKKVKIVSTLNRSNGRLGPFLVSHFPQARQVQNVESTSLVGDEALLFQ